MRLKEAALMSETYYQKPLLLCYSGGKDSDVILELAKMAGIPFEVQHSLTTADAPETVRHVKEKFKELEGVAHCEIIHAFYKGERTSMWKLIPQKLIPPTRIVRFCCSILKENTEKNRFIVTGVRWDESVKRENTRGIYESMAQNIKDRIILKNDNDEKRQLFESCKIQSKHCCNPIIDWEDDDVYSFLYERKIKLNPLYSAGYCRVGCVGCPLGRLQQRQREFADYPKIKQNYLIAFCKMIEERKRRGKETKWKTAEEVFHWWMEDGVLPGQMNLFEDNQEEDDG